MWIPASGAHQEYADYPRTLENMQAMWKRSRHGLFCKYESYPSPGRAETHCTCRYKWHPHSATPLSVNCNPGKVTTKMINSGRHGVRQRELHQCRTEQHSTGYQTAPMQLVSAARLTLFSQKPSQGGKNNSCRNTRKRASSTHMVQGSNWDSQLWFPAGLAENSSRGFSQATSAWNFPASAWSSVTMILMFPWWTQTWRTQQMGNGADGCLITHMHDSKH